VYTTHNRRNNGLGLLSLTMEEAAAEPEEVPLCRVLHLCSELALRHCARVKQTIEKAAEDYRQQMETAAQNEYDEGSDDDDEFNYMRREEQRREEVEAIEEGVSAVVLEGGPLHRFLPIIAEVLSEQLPASGSANDAEVQASAVIALGKFMLCSRQLAEEHVKSIAEVLKKGKHPRVLHAALAVLADMTMFIPNNAALHRSDGQNVLTQLLTDDILGRAALHQLLRLCSIRVVHATSHLGAIAASLKHGSDEPSILAFFANYLRNNTKRSGSSKARLLYKTYCDLPEQFSAADKKTVMLRLISSFCDHQTEKELTALLAKRLIEHVDSTAAELLYERRTAAVHTALNLVTQIGQRNLAALVIRVSTAQEKPLPDADRTEMQDALRVVNNLRKLLLLPSAQKSVSAGKRTNDRDRAVVELTSATDHLEHVADQFEGALHTDEGDRSSENEMNESDEDDQSMIADQEIEHDEAADAHQVEQEDCTTKEPTHTRRRTRASHTAVVEEPLSQEPYVPPNEYQDKSDDQEKGVVGTDAEGESKPTVQVEHKVNVSSSELYRTVHDVMKAADRTSLTKKGVRLLLAGKLGSEFCKKNKAAINKMIVDAMHRMSAEDRAAEDTAASASKPTDTVDDTPNMGLDDNAEAEEDEREDEDHARDIEHAEPNLPVPSQVSSIPSQASPTPSHDSPIPSQASSGAASGWAGLEEEEEEEHDDLPAHHPKGTGCENPRMCEFLEAAVAVAGTSAVKRSAASMLQEECETHVAEEQASETEEEAAVAPPVKRLHMQEDDEGASDDSLSLGSALDGA